VTGIDTDFAQHFATRAGKVNPSAPSTTNWNGIRDLLAEELGREPEDVYVSTISKPSNVSVRFKQSDAARARPVLLAMHTDLAKNLGKTIDALRKLAAPRGAFAVVAARGDGGWRIVSMLADEREPDATTLLAHFPDAIVVSP
jgi:hypothetical protein